MSDEEPQIDELADIVRATAAGLDADGYASVVTPQFVTEDQVTAALAALSLDPVSVCSMMWVPGGITVVVPRAMTTGGGLRVNEAREVEKEARFIPIIL